MVKIAGLCRNYLAPGVSPIHGFRSGRTAKVYITINSLMAKCILWPTRP
jgi:hypothetical protein